MIRILHWREQYEVNRSAALARPHWFPMPNGHDAEDYLEMVLSPDGAAAVGAWTRLLCLASQAPQGWRGCVVKPDGTAMTAAAISRTTRMPEDLLRRVAERAVRAGLAEWLAPPLEEPAHGVPVGDAARVPEVVVELPMVVQLSRPELPAPPAPAPEPDPPSPPPSAAKPEKPPKKPKAPPKPKLEFPALPAAFAAQASLWEQFVAMREAKKCPLTPNAAQIYFNRFAKWGPTKTAFAIENAIANNWQGIFEPKPGEMQGQGGALQPHRQIAPEDHAQLIRQQDEIEARKANAQNPPLPEGFHEDELW